VDRTPWYRYNVKGVGEVTESLHHVKESKIGSLSTFYERVIYVLIAGVVFEGMYLLTLLWHCGPVYSNSYERGLHIGAILLSLFATIFYGFSVFYFLTHPKRLRDVPLVCTFETGPCKSFAGHSDIGSWGPEAGWIVATIGFVISLITTVFTFVIRVPTTDYTPI